VGVPAATVQGPGFRSILWVDDELVNVAYEISILQNRGVNVITATSTREALGKLAGVEAVVTDSARQEYGQFNSRAGLDLIRLVDEQRPGLPVFIYTLASTAQRIRPEATDLGAAGVFGSSVDIIAALGPPPS
jgi:CheY-like chemotaxis protein